MVRSLPMYATCVDRCQAGPAPARTYWLRMLPLVSSSTFTTTRPTKRWLYCSLAGPVQQCTGAERRMLVLAGGPHNTGDGAGRHRLRLGQGPADRVPPTPLSRRGHAQAPAEPDGTDGEQMPAHPSSFSWRRRLGACSGASCKTEVP